MNQQRIGKFLSLLRKENNLTQEQLGEKLGVSSKTISRWENGNYMPDISMYEPLSKVLGVTINEILKGERIAEKDQLKESNKNILRILTSNKKQRKNIFYIIIFIIIILGIVGILSVMQTIRLEKIKEDYIDNVTFINNIYTNNNNVKINEQQYSILKTLQLTNGEIDNLTQIEFENYVNYYYAEIQSYEWYGYVGGYVPNTKTEDGFIVMKLVDKKLPLVAGPLESASGDYCYLGDSKYGTMILSKYEFGGCIITEIECTRLKEEGSTSKINFEQYCD